MSLVLDQFLKSVYNKEESIAIVVPNVSGLEVSFLVEHFAGLFLIAHVPLHKVRALYTDLALFVRGELLARLDVYHLGGKFRIE